MKIYISSASKKLSGIDRAFEKAYLEGKYTAETAKEFVTQYNRGVFVQNLYDSALKAIRYVDQNDISYPDQYYSKEMFCQSSDDAYDQYYNSGREARKEYVKQFKKFANTFNKKLISELKGMGIDGVDSDTELIELSAPFTDSTYSYAYVCTANAPILTDEQMSDIDNLIDSMLPEINRSYKQLFGGEDDFLEVSGDLSLKE